MIWSKVKLYLGVAVGAVISVLAIALRVRTKQYKAEKKERKAAQARADHAVEVITHDAEVDIQVDERLARIARGEGDELTDPNDWD